MRTTAFTIERPISLEASASDFFEEISSAKMLKNTWRVALERSEAEQLVVHKTAPATPRARMFSPM